MLKEVKDLSSAWEFVKEGWRMVKKYNWYDRTVRPYNWNEKVTKLLHEIADYGKCTKGSQAYLCSLANGLGDIMNAWEQFELEPEVTIEMVDGKIRTVKKSIAEMCIESGTGKEVV